MHACCEKVCLCVCHSMKEKAFVCVREREAEEKKGALEVPFASSSFKKVVGESVK